MTRAELISSMSFNEFYDWIAYYSVRADIDEERMEEIKKGNK